MAIKITKKPTAKVAVKAETSVTHSKTGAVVKEEIKEMVEVPQPYANVGVGAARTINLGEYNSVKISVDIHRPCANTDEAIEETYAKCIEFVDEKMAALTEAHDGGAHNAD